MYQVTHFQTDNAKILTLIVCKPEMINVSVVSKTTTWTTTLFAKFTLKTAFLLVQEFVQIADQATNWLIASVFLKTVISTILSP